MIRVYLLPKVLLVAHATVQLSLPCLEGFVILSEDENWCAVE